MCSSTLSSATLLISSQLPFVKTLMFQRLNYSGKNRLLPPNVVTVREMYRCTFMTRQVEVLHVLAHSLKSRADLVYFIDLFIFLYFAINLKQEQIFQKDFKILLLGSRVIVSHLTILVCSNLLSIHGWGSFCTNDSASAAQQEVQSVCDSAELLKYLRLLWWRPSGHLCGDTGASRLPPDRLTQVPSWGSDQASFLSSPTR